MTSPPDESTPNTARSQFVDIGSGLRDPEAILADPQVVAAGFDLGEPACVILGCVLHFVDAETAHGMSSCRPASWTSRSGRRNCRGSRRPDDPA